MDFFDQANVARQGLWSRTLEAEVGIAAGLTDASDDVVIKSLLEWEL